MPLPDRAHLYNALWITCMHEQYIYILIMPEQTKTNDNIHYLDAGKWDAINFICFNDCSTTKNISFSDALNDKFRCRYQMDDEQQNDVIIYVLTWYAFSTSDSASTRQVVTMFMVAAAAFAARWNDIFLRLLNGYAIYIWVIMCWTIFFFVWNSFILFRYFVRIIRLAPARISMN